MSYNNPNYKGKRNKNNQPDILQTIVVGIFKLLWWLVTLPFKGFKLGKGKSGLSLEDRNYIASKRHEIESLFRSQSVIELKHAVMEADKLADFVLKAKGFQGETFADRLRSAQSFLSSSLYNQLWQGHKVRNQIAHESELTIMNSELREAAEKLLKFTQVA